jgi:hypothetical protein
MVDVFAMLALLAIIFLMVKNIGDMGKWRMFTYVSIASLTCIFVAVTDPEGFREWAAVVGLLWLTIGPMEFVFVMLDPTSLQLQRRFNGHEHFTYANNRLIYAETKLAEQGLEINDDGEFTLRSMNEKRKAEKLHLLLTGRVAPGRNPRIADLPPADA